VTIHDPKRDHALPGSGHPLFERGIVSAEVDKFRVHSRDLVTSVVGPRVAEAERSGCFPRAVIGELASSGLFVRRWDASPAGDPGRAVVFAEQLGATCSGGIALGVTIHAEGVLAALTRHGETPELRSLREDAVNGRQIGCLAFTEVDGGSDLLQTQTTAVRTASGWRITGTKPFVSLGATADFAIVLAREGESVNEGHPGVAAPLSVFVVPSAGWSVIRRRRGVGLHSLDTVALQIDTEVPPEYRLGRSGRGMLVLTHALTAERLAVTAALVGCCDAVLSVAVRYLRQRYQFGRLLYDHQALRLRAAELKGDIDRARTAVYCAAAHAGVPGVGSPRDVAGLKVHVARMAERVTSEAMQFLGGLGYLDEGSPLARAWRDVRVARIGGGTDEILLELAAGGLTDGPADLLEAVLAQ